MCEWYQDSLRLPDAEDQIAVSKNMLASQADVLWLIGTVGNAPHALIVNNDLRNVPEDGLWTWDTHIEGVVTEHPLADWNQFDGHEIPDPLVQGDRGPMDWPAAAKQIRQQKHRAELLAAGWPTAFFSCG